MNDPADVADTPDPAQPRGEKPTPPVLPFPPPRKPKNADVRGREYLTAPEVARLGKAAAKLGRHGHRDSTIVLTSYVHGLRVAELVSMRRDQLDLDAGSMTIVRKKRGKPSTHPIPGPELRALRKVLRDYPDSPYVFPSERGGPLSESCVRKMVARAGIEAKLGLSVHPHMLRHACGYKLANDGQDTRAIQDYLGHRNIQHTVHYTEMAPDRFKKFWKD